MAVDETALVLHSVDIVQRLTPTQWQTRREDWIQSVLQTEEIAYYCSGPDWGSAAAQTLHNETNAIILNREESWVVLGQSLHPELGWILHPREAAWGFASPMLGSDDAMNARLLADGLALDDVEWNAVCLSGLSKALVTKITDELQSSYRIVCHPGIRFQRASLQGGVDGFLSRRTPRFRKNLRRSQEEIHRAGITFTSCQPHAKEVPTIWERIQRVEATSWKWAKNDSVLQNEPYQAFYQALLRLAASRNALHVGFAQEKGTDVAYVVGGVLGLEYRGFQMSFDDRFRSLGLGNVMQMAMIEQLSKLRVRTYDLGMDMNYKARWSDEDIQLHTVFLFRE